jgi:hypothetical protein
MIAAIAKAPVDPALISTDVGSNPSDCMLELASGKTQIKYAMSHFWGIDKLEKFELRNLKKNSLHDDSNEK